MTRLSSSAECSKCGNMVNTSGMIGGGWRVEGDGFNELTLDIRCYPDMEGSLLRIVVDRNGRIVSVGHP